MLAESSPDRSKQVIKALKHFAAVSTLGHPVLIMLFAWVRDPATSAKLWIPDPKIYYFNTFLVIILLISLVLSYLFVVFVANTIIALIQEKPAGIYGAFGMIKIILLWAGMDILLTLALVCGVLGPPALDLYQSPVGSMFFGG
jgi:hypothetical protein